MHEGLKMDPIVVNEMGEAVVPASMRTTDTSELFWEQIHLVCDGRMNLQTVSPTHRAMHCPKCGLRVIFPKKVGTYGELRKYFKRFNKRKKGAR